MKLKFLGTSAAWPLPRMGCHCEICSSTDPKDTRKRASALLNDTFLIDAGFDCYLQLTKFADPTKIKYVYITHDHPDHYAGLWDLSHITGGPKIKLITHPNTYKTIERWVEKGDFEPILLEENHTLEIEGLEISNSWVHHTKETAFGLIAQQGTTRMFYMPDFKTLPATTETKIKDFDLMVMDAAEWEISSHTHQTVLQGIELAKRLNVKQAYFTHIGHRTKKYQIFNDHLIKSAPQVHVPFDGLEIEI